MAKKKTVENKLIVTYSKSTIGYDRRQRGTIRALGLRRLGDVAEHKDSPVVRGMIASVSHLVTVEEVKA